MLVLWRNFLPCQKQYHSYSSPRLNLFSYFPSASYPPLYRLFHSLNINNISDLIIDCFKAGICKLMKLWILIQKCFYHQHSVFNQCVKIYIFYRFWAGRSSQTLRFQMCTLDGEYQIVNSKKLCSVIPTNLVFFLKEPDFSEDQEEKKKDSKKTKVNLLERRSTRTRKCISYRYEIYGSGSKGKSIECFYTVTAWPTVVCFFYLGANKCSLVFQR